MTLARSEAPRAFKLFLEETVKHLAWWEACCGAKHDASQEAVTEARAAPFTEAGAAPFTEAGAAPWQEAARRAHTVKGGAGFFGLTEIVDAARALEKYFQEADAEGNLCSERVQPLLSDLRRHLERVQAEDAAGDD